MTEDQFAPKRKKYREVDLDMHVIEGDAQDAGARLQQEIDRWLIDVGEKAVYARIEITHWGETRLEMSIYRLETEKEVAVRKKKSEAAKKASAARERNKREKDRKLYEKLKKKFEGG